MRGQHVDERQLDVASSAAPAGGLELRCRARRPGRAPPAPAPWPVSARRRRRRPKSSTPWPRRPRPRPQLAAEVAQHQVGEVVGALVGPDQVGRQGGVAGHAAQRQAARGQRLHRTLGVVQRLGPRRVGQPGAPAPPRRRGRASVSVDVRRGAVGRGQRQRLRVTACRGPTRRRRARPTRDAGARRARPASRRPRPAPSTDCRRASKPPRPRPRRLEGLEQPLAQHPELQAVEDLVHLRRGPRPGAPGRRDRDWQLEVADQRVEPAVAEHAVEVLAQALAGLALDLVDVRDDAVEVAVLVIHLAAVFGPTPGTPAGCRWSRRPARPGRCSARAARRTSPRTACGRHPGQLGDARDGVEHGDVVA